ncbi:Adenine phosphoribosyltransferase 2, partial [Dichanthelium oligosanthes]
MGEEASCNAVSVMEAATNAKQPQQPKENGCAAAAVAAGEAVAVADPRLQGISDAIRVVPHFPKQGIMFNDITTLLLRPGVFKDAVDLFVERYRGMGIHAVAGIEARGFIFGPAIALAIGAKFIPLRKPRKLPERAGADVVECACLIGLPKFK